MSGFDDFFGIGQAIGSLVGAGFSYAGGREASKEANAQQLFNYQAQKEFAQSGIRWKVEDAKAAGLHPLFALGGSGATFSPSAIVTPQGEALARAGQDVGRAATAVLTGIERAAVLSKLEESRAAARKDDAEASWWESAAARARQAGPAMDLDPGTSWGVAGDPAGVILSSMRPQDEIKGYPLPPEVPPGWITSSPPKSSWDRRLIGPGLEMLLPEGSSMSEALESVSESTLMGASIVGMNARHYGPGWLRRVADHFGWPDYKLNAIERKLLEIGGAVMRGPGLSPGSSGEFMFPR